MPWNSSEERLAREIACELYEGAQPDAGPDWDLDDAFTFVIEHMAMGDFFVAYGTQKPVYSVNDEILRSLVREELSKYY